MPRWTLIPLINVLEFGSAKYSADNWKKGLNRDELLESMQRHVDELTEGEELDKESQLHHVGHIMANCVFYYWFHIKNKFSKARIVPYGDSFKRQIKKLKKR